MNENPKTLLSRRSTFSRLAGIGAAAWFIPAWNETMEAADAITCVTSTPTVTEGPYWVDEKLFRSDVRTDPASGVARAGVPLSLTITIQNLSSGSCVPLTGAYIDIWHCDAKGIYSDESTYNPGGGTGNVTTTGQKFLRGYQITDGNGQVTFTTIYPGWYSGRTIHIHVRVRTYSGTTVLGNFVTQVFFDDSVNNTVMAQSTYSRSTARDTTNANDMVYQIASKERMLATVSGDVTNGYAASITAGVSLSAPSAISPSISSGGVVNAVGGAAGVTPGSWISIYGSGFSTVTRALTSSDLVNNTIPTSLGGVSVQIDNKPAYIGYINPTQINVLAPSDSATGAVPVTVTNSVGISNSVIAVLQPVLPGLSVAGSYVRAVRYPDGAIINGTGAAETGYTSAAAIGQGDILALYGTGFGPTTSTLASGVIFTGAYPAANAVTVTIGGVSAQVLWAGLVGAGLYQINLVVPTSVADGDQVVLASVSGLSSQSGALLKVSAAAKLSTQSIAGGVIATRRALQHAKSGIPPSATRRRVSGDLVSLAGLLGAGFIGPERHSNEGGELARLGWRAAAEQGGIVQLA